MNWVLHASMHKYRLLLRALFTNHHWRFFQWHHLIAKCTQLKNSLFNIWVIIALLSSAMEMDQHSNNLHFWIEYTFNFGYINLQNVRAYKRKCLVHKYLSKISLNITWWLLNYHILIIQWTLRYHIFMWLWGSHICIYWITCLWWCAC